MPDPSPLPRTGVLPGSTGSCQGACPRCGPTRCRSGRRPQPRSVPAKPPRLQPSRAQVATTELDGIRRRRRSACGDDQRNRDQGENETLHAPNPRAVGGQRPGSTPFLLVPRGSDRAEMAGSSRRHVGDGVLAARPEMSIVLRPHRLAGLLVTLARGLPTLVPGRQGRSGRRAARQQVAESGPQRHAPESTPGDSRFGCHG